MQPMTQTPDVNEDVAALAAQTARATPHRRGAPPPPCVAPSTAISEFSARAATLRMAAASGVDLPSLPRPPVSLRASRGWGLSSPYTTLEAALRSIPTAVGFNIELKYPWPAEAAAHGLAYAERNEYVDAVLEVCGRVAGARGLCFSTFDPDTARVARRKQVGGAVSVCVIVGGDLLTIALIAMYSLDGQYCC